MLPFNVDLLTLPPEQYKNMRPVTTLDTREGASQNFHEDGLYSVSIFGRVGSEERDNTFSYIDIKTTILHPIVYYRLIRLKGLYKNIIAGKTYAKWDPEQADFVASNEMDGETGYHFFISHWKDIQFKKTKSPTRNQRIELIEKYRDQAMVSKILVIPAGIRDIQVNDSGRVSEDEINKLYRKVLSRANTIGVKGEKANDPVMDNVRYSLQMAFNEIYDYLENLLNGKKGLVQKKWGSRRIFNGTRNVISSMDTSVTELGEANSPKFNDTAVGLYQLMKAALPVTKHLLLNGYLSQVFGQADNKALLVNKKTLQPEYVEIEPDTHDRWFTSEGLDQVINRYAETRVRHDPLEIEGYYLGLIYIGGNDDFRIFNDIRDLPEDFSRENVQPLTFCQLMYLSGYQRWNELRGYVTRYPVTGIESIYPTQIYVKTTVKGEKRWELDESWNFMGDEFVALEFPRSDIEDHLDSLVPHSSRLGGLGADFDGDTSSLDVCYTQESIEEINEMLNKKEAYLDPRGGLKASTSIDTVDLVLKNMTGA